MKGTDPTCDGTGPHKVKSHTPQMLCKKLSANIWGCTIFRGEWWAFFFFQFHNMKDLSPLKFLLNIWVSEVNLILLGKTTGKGERLAVEQLGTQVFIFQNKILKLRFQVCCLHRHFFISGEEQKTHDQVKSNWIILDQTINILEISITEGTFQGC